MRLDIKFQFNSQLQSVRFVQIITQQKIFANKYIEIISTYLYYLNYWITKLIAACIYLQF